MLNRAFSSEDHARLSDQAVVLSDGPVVVDRIERHPRKLTHLRVSIHSGRNRVLRRLFSELGYEVRALDRCSVWTFG